MRIAPTAALALALVAATAAGVPYASRLDGVADAVQAKVDGMEPWVGRPPADVRALLAARRTLELPRESLRQDFRRGVPVARALDRWWPADPDLEPALATAADDLHNDVLVERNALMAWTGRTGSDHREEVLARGLGRARDLLFGGDQAATRVENLVLYGRACRALLRTRQSLRLGAPPSDQPPFEGLAPDFSLADQNPNSATFAQQVSPRDHVGRVTAWYFTRLT